jgi:hypothetical protein
LKKILVAGLGVGTMLTFAPAANAAPEGRRCGFSTLTDPQIEGSQSGQINAGPLVLDTTNPTASGFITCTIQVGTNDTHAEADAAKISGTTSTGVAALAGSVTYEVGTDEDVWICTEVHAGATVYYWDAASASWSTTGGTCDLSTSIETPPVGGEIDFLICPILAIVFPPEGDVLNIWDCPPYNS